MTATCGQMRAAGAFVPPHRQDHEAFSDEPAALPFSALAVFISPTGRRYLDADDLGRICGINGHTLDRKFRPFDWATPRDFRWDGRRVWFAEQGLQQLADTLFARGANDAGILLSTWLTRYLAGRYAEEEAARMNVRNNLDGGTAALAGTGAEPPARSQHSRSTPGAGVQPSSAPAVASTPRDAAAPVEKSRLLAWEEEHG